MNVLSLFDGDDFECIWSKEQTRTLDYNKENQPKKVEKLFVWKG